MVGPFTPTIRGYTQATSLGPTDAIEIDRIGTGTMWVEAGDCGNNVIAFQGRTIYATLPLGVTDSWTPTGYDATVRAIGISTTAQDFSTNYDGGILTGLTGGTTGRRITLFNYVAPATTNGNILIYATSSASSTDGFLGYNFGSYSQSTGDTPFPPLVIPPSCGLDFLYDASSALWQPVGAPPYLMQNAVQSTLAAGVTQGWFPDGFSSTVDTVMVAANVAGSTLYSLLGGATNNFYGLWKMRPMTLINVGPGALTIKSYSGTLPHVTDWGHFVLPGTSDLTIPLYGGATFKYWTGAIEGWYLTHTF